MSRRRVCALTLVPLTLALLVLSADPTSPSERQPTVVQATVVENPPPRPPGIEALQYDEPGPRGMLPLPASMLEPSQRLVPSAMEPPPKPLRPDGAPEDETRILSLDVETGEVTERSIAGLEELLERYTEAGIGVGELLEDPEGVRKNFSIWQEISDPTVGTYPRHVKLFMDFVDINGTDVGGVCSGTLIDPKHVLTAGHCVWSHDLGGHFIGNFAVSIEVVPAYKNGNKPYGNALAAQMHIWNLWIDDRDYDHDLAVIDLDRPIGALTGWWGYGFSESCDFWETQSWRHAGWPAEDPFTGELLYRNLGDFDDCVQDGWDNRAEWNSPTWGGTSGAGALKLDTSAVYGAFSTSDRSTVSVDCKLTATKFGQIGQMISDDKPPGLDLVVLDVNAPAAIESGYNLGNLDFAVINYSHGTMNATWPFEMYLSTDDFITTGDVYLGSGSYTYNFGDNTSVRVNAPSPTIPANTPTGDYFVGVILTHADWNHDNNASHGQEASPITVTCGGAPAPTLSAPWNGQPCTSRDVYFKWTAEAPLATYQLRLGTSCGSGTVVETNQVSYQWNGLAASTTYHWQVRTMSQCAGWGSWSSCFSFRTEANPYAVTSVIAPVEGEHCVGTTAQLEWAPLPDAVTYDLQYSPVWCYQGPIVTGIASPQYSLSGLSPDTDYYWRVRAHTTCGQTTNWSSVPGFCFNFKTAPTGTIASPSRIGPGDGTTCGSASTHLLWSHADDWDHYEVQVGTSCGTGPVYSTTANGFSPPGLVSGEVYYWRVRTFHECGLVSAWTDCWSFSLDLEPPTNPTTLASNTHTVGVWSTDNTVDVWWDWGYDNCAGSFPQYATLWDQSPITEPTVPTTSGELTLETSPPLPDGQNHWFHVRTIDWAGNMALETLHLGPFWIDATAPTKPELDYATLDPGLITGPTTLIADWLACTDDLSGLVGYSWATGPTSMPPVGLDNTADTTDLWAVAPMSQTGGFWLFVRAVDLAGNGSPDLVLGPLTVDPQRFGVFVKAPTRGDVLTEGMVFRIRWDIYEPLLAFVRNAQLDYSLDAGGSYQRITSLNGDQFGLSHYDWTVPMAMSNEAVVLLTATDMLGRVVYDRSVRFTLEQVTGTPPVMSTDRYFLAAARPSPFNPRTSIEYTVPHGAQLSLRIYDAYGRLVRTLVEGWRDGPARHVAEWDGEDDHGLTVASGVYHYTLEAEGFRQSRSMVLVK